MLIFISHSSKTPEAKIALDKLAEEVTDILGYDVWYDPALKEHGGYEWWAEILENIRRCDIFIFALTPQWLASLACELEYAYANALGKPMLPVMLEKVEDQALSGELQQLQYVDYLPGNEKRLVNLKKSLNNLKHQIKSGQQDILMPEAPLRNTPLAALKSQITQPELSVNEQWQLFGRFKELLLSQETPNNTIYLLKRFRQQPGLDATVAHSIDETLENWFDKQQPTKPTRSFPVKWVAIAVILVVVLVGGALFVAQLGGQGSSTPTPLAAAALKSPSPTADTQLPTAIPAATLRPTATLISLFNVSTPTTTPIVLFSTPKPTNTSTPVPTVVQSLINSNMEVITLNNASRIQQIGAFQVGKVVTGGTMNIAWSPDGSLIAVAATGVGVKLYDANDLLAAPRIIQGYSNQAASVAFSPDQKYLAIGSLDADRIWNLATNELVWPFINDCGGNVTYSPDGQYFLRGACKSELQIWDIATQDQKMKMTVSRNGEPFSLAFRRDGKFFVTGSMDTSVKIWNAASGKAILTVTGDSYCVTAVAYSPDGRSILDGGCDEKVLKWDTTSGQLLFLERVEGVVYAVAYSPDSRLFLTASANKRVKIWDASNGNELAALSEHPDELRSAVFSPDGRFIASGSIDGTVRIWGVPPL
ncbi:MAG: TIR domain-containing protein [Chloroflexota bacterium]